MKRVVQYDEEGNAIEEDEPELEEGEEKSFEGYILDKTIAPTSTIVLKQQHDFLLNRVKNLN